MDLDKLVIRIFKQTSKLQNELLNSGHFIARRLKRKAQINATFYPKIRTGELFKSIRTEVRLVDGKVTVALKAGNDVAFYAKFMEFGTRRLRPRYFLLRAEEDTLAQIPKDLRDRTKKLLENING